MTSIPTTPQAPTAPTAPKICWGKPQAPKSPSDAEAPRWDGGRRWVASRSRGWSRCAHGTRTCPNLTSQVKRLVKHLVVDVQCFLFETYGSRNSRAKDVLEDWNFRLFVFEHVFFLRLWPRMWQELICWDIIAGTNGTSIYWKVLTTHVKNVTHQHTSICKMEALRSLDLCFQSVMMCYANGSSRFPAGTTLVKPVSNPDPNHQQTKHYWDPQITMIKGTFFLFRSNDMWIIRERSVYLLGSCAMLATWPGEFTLQFLWKMFQFHDSTVLLVVVIPEVMLPFDDFYCPPCWHLNDHLTVSCWTCPLIVE